MAKDYFGDLESDVEPVASRGRNYVGQRYSKWEVIESLGKSRYLCRCECGNEAVKLISHLKGLRSMQCKKCYLNSINYFMIQKGS